MAVLIGMKAVSMAVEKQQRTKPQYIITHYPCSSEEPVETWYVTSYEFSGNRLHFVAVFDNGNVKQTIVLPNNTDYTIKSLINE